MAKKKRVSRRRTLTAQQLGRLMRSVLKSIPDPESGGATPGRAARAGLAAAAATAVMFKCNNPLCIVGMKIAGVPGFSFVSQHAISLPAATRNVGWKVTSSPSGEGFNVTVTGGTLDVPISGITGPNSGGVAQLTV